MSIVAQQNISFFKSFLLKYTKYQDEIRKIVDNKLYRLIINMDDLRSFDNKIASQIQQEPLRYILDFEMALYEFINTNHPKHFEDNAGTEIHLGFEGQLGADCHVSPRDLLAFYANKLICLSGIITKCSSVIQRIIRIINYCEKTNKFTDIDFTSEANILASHNGGAGLNYQDAEGNILETEFGLSQFTDTQSLFIQEAPENAPAGQLPRSIECIVEHDLVDKVKPGDRVTFYGIYKAIPPSGGNQTKLSSKMRMVFIVNNIVRKEFQLENEIYTPKEIQNIEYLSKRKDAFEVLSQGIAPTIYGHDIIKKSLLLQMLGGVEKNFAKSNTHVRGDINILLVGDPSTAKSQLLRFMLHTCPLAISTTGRASTGVGLTAAVVSDKDTGDRTLQAGAMVLADRGVVCIDEFDKMSDIDRVAMHEVMEQQTVTIQKAGVHASLNARCSVLAAANPIYGQYNREASIQRNIGLPDSLLSRFDLIYILLDERNEEKDRLIGTHVLNVHKQQASQYHSSKVGISQESKLDDFDAMTTFFKELQKIPDTEGTYQSQSHLVIPISFLKKFIQYVKRKEPILSEEARELIHEKYLEFREGNMKGHKTLPITPRTLESFIRLSTAHAKMRLSEAVTKEDVEAAFKLMYYSIWFINNTNNTNSILVNLSNAEEMIGNKKTNKKKTTSTSTTNMNGSEQPVTIEEDLDEKEAITLVKKAIHQHAQDGCLVTEMQRILQEENSLPKTQFEKILKMLDEEVFCIIEGPKVFYCGE
ncbi:hypothetical protein ABK040_001570 [Willaertia magna]